MVLIAFSAAHLVTCNRCPLYLPVFVAYHCTPPFPPFSLSISKLSIFSVVLSINPFSVSAATATATAISFRSEAMLLKAAPGISLLTTYGENLPPLFSSGSSQGSQNSGIVRVSTRKNRPGIVVSSSKGGNNRPLTGVIFEPFEEVKKELSLVPTTLQVSLARQKFTGDCEGAINEQINVEYNVSYVYHALFAYFDRDNVALKGLAKFFKESSLEEREHAEKLMEYQNKRGGKVKLLSIVMPLSEFDHADKGDALYAMELALSLEKLTNEKLLNLHSVALRNNDAQLADFVETEYLSEQVEAIKKMAEYVTQLRRVGKGHGVWHFNQMLLHEGEEVVA